MQVINQQWVSLAQRINTCIRCLVPAAACFYLNICFCTSLTFSKRLPTTPHLEDKHLVYFAFSPRRVSIDTGKSLDECRTISQVPLGALPEFRM
jgi:hypothetical protein